MTLTAPSATLITPQGPQPRDARQRLVSGESLETHFTEIARHRISKTCTSGPRDDNPTSNLSSPSLRRAKALKQIETSLTWSLFRGCSEKRSRRGIVKIRRSSGSRDTLTDLGTPHFRWRSHFAHSVGGEIAPGLLIASLEPRRTPFPGGICCFQGLVPS